MDPSEMEQRRSAALDALQEAINELGPITDATGHTIREPLLDIVDLINEAGSELQDLEFEKPPTTSEDD